MDTKLFDIEKTYREVIMGEKPSFKTSEVIIEWTTSTSARDYSELCRKLDDAANLLQHIRNNWDKEDFDGEEMDRKIDELLGRIR